MTSWQRNGTRRSVSALIDVVQRYKRTTVKQITEVTGLSRGTVTNLVDQLVNVGALAKSATSGDQLGRKPQAISLGPAAGVLVGVELGFYATAIAVEDPDGTMIAEIRDDDPAIVENPFLETLSTAVELTVTALRRRGITGSQIRGIGLAIRAPVDHTSGEVLSRDSLRDFPPIAPNDEFASGLAKALGTEKEIPGFLGNDAQLGAWGAHCFRTSPSATEVARRRATYDREKLMFVKVTDAIRVGFVNGGEPDWGGSFPSGDFSHQIVRGLDPVPESQGGEIECPRCGTSMCLSTKAAGPFVKERVYKARGEVGGPLSLSSIVAESNGRNLECMGILESAGVALGRAIVNFISVAGYDEIVLGGVLSSADVLVGAVQEEVRNSLGSSVHVAPQPKLAVARGAIELARSRTLPLFLGSDPAGRLATAE